MKVFLDTNIAISENFLRTTYVEAFLKAARLLGIEIIIPDVVLDEIKGNYAEKLNEKFMQFEKAYKELGKFIVFEIEEPDLSQKIDEYVGWLNDLLDEYDIHIVQYPQNIIKEMVCGSYLKRKPFKDDGTGHKDFILWKSVLAEVLGAADGTECYFITNNTKDFCNPANENGPTIHDDFLSEMNGRSISIYTSLRKFFDEKIKISLRNVSLDNIPDLSRSDIEGYAAEALYADLINYSAYGFKGLGFSNDVMIMDVSETEIQTITCTDIDEKILIEISGTIDIDVHGFIEKHHYYEVTEYDEEKSKALYVIDSDWNDWVMAIGKMITTPFELSISYIKSSNQIEGHSIILTDEINNPLFE